VSFSFKCKEEGGVGNLMNCFFKMSGSKIQRRSVLKSWTTERMIQENKAGCNKEKGYAAAAKI
jgi:hypothetical protein